MEMILLFVIFGLIALAIIAALSRWIFRINEIVLLLKNILRALEVGLELEDAGKKGKKE